MQVTRYQMQNVMDCYSKKLSRALKSEKQSARPGEKKPGDEVSLAASGNRQAALEKISREIIYKITDAGALESPPERSEEAKPAREGLLAEGDAHPDSLFTYDVIDSFRQKHRATLAEGDAQSLVRRLGQVHSGPPNHQTDSWI